MAKLTPRFEEFLTLGPHGFCRIGYTEWGPRDAQRTVICVHGLTRNSRDFDFLAMRLVERGMRVVAPDLPGRGRSDPAASGDDYGTPLYLAAMAGLISRLGVRDVDWVGTSLGGHIGMELAARPGSPIRHLVLNDFGARIPVAALQRIGRYLRTAHPFATIGEVEAYLREIYAPFGALTGAQWHHMAVHGVVQDKAGLRLHYDPAIVEQFSRPLLLDVALWRVWEHVACAVLILRGEYSDLLLPETVAEMKRRGIAAAQGLVQSVEVKGCGHAPALMADDQIRLVEDFLLAEPARAQGKRTAKPREAVQ
jgi:pimeloyl-ACP methyl ester carboxylesterase